MNDLSVQKKNRLDSTPTGAEPAGGPLLLIAILWTVLITTLAGWNYQQLRQAALQEAQTSARQSFSKDQTFRRWAAGHGGVYVPVTADTPPSPFLAHIPERNIVTPSGRVLTLLNPDYMIRQINEMADDLSGTRGHITSLRPSRPENAADEWEAIALKAFEDGAIEKSALAPIAADTYLRLMRPLRAEPGCLKCHEDQNYQPGNIMGGVSVSLPWVPYRQALLVSLRGIGISYGSLWLLGLLGIAWYRKCLQQHLAQRRQVEQSLLQQTRQLEKRTDELESFTYAVSHDLKSPLVTIKTFLGFLAVDLAADNAQSAAKDLNYIHSAANRMEKLLNELSQFPHLGQAAVTAEAIGFRELVDEALDSVAGGIATRGVRIKVADRDVILHGDRPRLVEIWQNLIDNAAKYMGDQKAPQIEIGFDDSGPERVFYVRDNGMGIDPEDHETIFGLFQRLDPAGDGSGLGLALVKRIVEINQGSIWVVSAGWNAGSCFYFTLPQTKVAPAGQ